MIEAISGGPRHDVVSANVIRRPRYRERASTTSSLQAMHRTAMRSPHAAKRLSRLRVEMLIDALACAPTARSIRCGGDGCRRDLDGARVGANVYVVARPSGPVNRTMRQGRHWILLPTDCAATLCSSRTHRFLRPDRPPFYLFPPEIASSTGTVIYQQFLSP
jgi:hypothetical protein